MEMRMKYVEYMGVEITGVGCAGCLVVQTCLATLFQGGLEYLYLLRSTVSVM